MEVSQKGLPSPKECLGYIPNVSISKKNRFFVKLIIKNVQNELFYKKNLKNYTKFSQPSSRKPLGASRFYKITSTDSVVQNRNISRIEQTWQL